MKSLFQVRKAISVSCPAICRCLRPLVPECFRYRKGNKRTFFAVSGGFAEVLPDSVIIMADMLERPEEIDVQRARAAKERAEKMLTSRDVDVEQVMAAILRATSRIHVAEMR